MATWTYKSGDPERKDFMVFYVTTNETENIAKANIEVIGKGIEDMPISHNAESEETQDILGNNNYAITGYAPSFTVDPLNVTAESKYAQKIDEMIETLPTGGALELTYMAVKRYKTDATGKMRAWVQKGIVELGDFAAGLKSVSASHTVHWVGERTLGVVAPDTMVFTTDESTANLEL